MPQGIILKGITTIFWGTDSTGPTAPTGVVCARGTFRPAPSTGVVGRIENNNGGEAATILLDDGFDFEGEYVYDSAKTWPVLGAAITVKSPSDGTGKTCLVTNKPIYEMTAERKKEGMITVKAEYRPDRATA